MGVGTFIFFLISSLAIFVFRSLGWLQTPTARFLVATFPKIYRPCCRLGQIRYSMVRVANEEHTNAQASDDAVIATELLHTRRAMRRCGRNSK